MVADGCVDTENGGDNRRPHPHPIADLRPVFRLGQVVETVIVLGTPRQRMEDRELLLKRLGKILRTAEASLVDPLGLARRIPFIMKSGHIHGITPLDDAPDILTQLAVNATA